MRRRLPGAEASRRPRGPGPRRPGLGRAPEEAPAARPRGRDGRTHRRRIINFLVVVKDNVVRYHVSEERINLRFDHRRPPHHPKASAADRPASPHLRHHRDRPRRPVHRHQDRHVHRPLHQNHRCHPSEPGGSRGGRTRTAYGPDGNGAGAGGALRGREAVGFAGPQGRGAELTPLPYTGAQQLRKYTQGKSTKHNKDDEGQQGTIRRLAQLDLGDEIGATSHRMMVAASLPPQDNSKDDVRAIRVEHN
mmetsp:Transcript_19475/g.56024  ORF Transcript_19475/g.56024 Transcript_19475/m.56024 type:complete len:249 (+) Transcript_19475:865-1611(+)